MWRHRSLVPGMNNFNGYRPRLIPSVKPTPAPSPPSPPDPSLAAGVTPVQQETIEAMRGANLPLAAASAVTGLPRPVVRAVDALPRIQAHRTRIRRTTLAGIREHVPEAYRWLGDLVKSRDSVELERLTGSLWRLERVASSAAGEAHRIESTVTQTVDHHVDVNVELKVALAALMGIKPDLGP